ncbi:hypothetical protein NBRC116588_32090 [Pyruvatibacter sp. HU-CL02332]
MQQSTGTHARGEFEILVGGFQGLWKNEIASHGYVLNLGCVILGLRQSVPIGGGSLPTIQPIILRGLAK